MLHKFIASLCEVSQQWITLPIAWHQLINYVHTIPMQEIIDGYIITMYVRTTQLYINVFTV